MKLYGVTTDYDKNEKLSRDYIQVWSGPFMTVWEADGASLPNGNGYMLTLPDQTKIKVECPSPRTDESYEEIDAAINERLNRHYAERK